MKSFILENREDELVLRINKNKLSKEYLALLIKRLTIEELAKKASFKKDILRIADSIDKTWWKKNEKDFLKDVKK